MHIPKGLKLRLKLSSVGKDVEQLGLSRVAGVLLVSACTYFTT